MPESGFSSQDAQAIITMVQRAPLQNMREAEAVSLLLERFRTWYNAVTNTPEPPIEDGDKPS